MLPFMNKNCAAAFLTKRSKCSFPGYHAEYYNLIAEKLQLQVEIVEHGYQNWAFYAFVDSINNGSINITAPQFYLKFDRLEQLDASFYPFYFSKIALVINIRQFRYQLPVLNAFNLSAVACIMTFILVFCCYFDLFYDSSDLLIFVTKFVFGTTYISANVIENFGRTINILPL